MCSVQTQSPFSLDLKITCHPPPLHNSISVSIKVGSESLKTENRSTIRCLPWKPFHCQLGKECAFVCMCDCERAHRLSESLTVWPSAPRLLSPVRSSLSRSNTHSPQCYFFQTDRYGKIELWKHCLIQWCLQKSTATWKDFRSSRKHCMGLWDSSCADSNQCTILCIHADLCNQQVDISIYFSCEQAEILRKKDLLHHKHG